MTNYEYAARNKLRFESTRGLLTTEQLFDLPLTSTGDRPSLNEVGKKIREQLKSIDADEDLVETTSSTKQNRDLEIAFEIVKDIINIKKAEKTAREEQVKKSEEKRFYEELLVKARQKQAEGLTEEQILEKIKEIG